ncbi:MAG TPA: hypothetical protein PLQ01_05060 [Methanothrix sp.]|nr:hypothetical protein [Methanothrix sp.]
MMEKLFDEIEEEDEKPSTVIEDEFVDLENIEALDEAMKPVTGEFPLTLPNGKKLKIPYKVMGFAYGLEASAGERFKENEVNDPKKTKRIYMRKINMGLLDGWKVVDDIERPALLKGTTRSGLLAKKMIPISIITPRDWNLLNETLFPGALDQPETIQDRARAIRDNSV